MMTWEELTELDTVQENDLTIEQLVYITLATELLNMGRHMLPTILIGLHRGDVSCFIDNMESLSNNIQLAEYLNNCMELINAKQSIKLLQLLQIKGS